MRNVVSCMIVSMSLFAPADVAAQRLQQQGGALPSLSPAAQIAIEDLAPRYASEIELRPGWFRDQPVLYYDFGRMPEPVVTGRVVWPIHGFDARGNPVAMRGQRPVFSAIPGLEGYSGTWRLSYLVTADRVQPNELRDMASVNAAIRARRAQFREPNLVLNLPIVPRGSTLSRDSAVAILGWYEGRDIQYFDFGVVSTAPVPLLAFVRGVDAMDGRPQWVLDQHNILDSLPLSPPFADLWAVRLVHVDSGYAGNTLRSAAAVSADPAVRVDSPESIRNCPIVFVDGSPMDRAPSPLRAFADLRSPFPPAPTRSP